MVNSKDIVDSIRAIKKIQENHLKEIANTEEDPTEEDPTEGTGASAEIDDSLQSASNFFMFSLNPFLPGIAETATISKIYTEKIPKDCVPIAVVADSGGDGAFDVNCFTSWKNHKLGANFPLKDGAAPVITSFKTFAKMLLDKVNTNNNKRESISIEKRDIMLDKILKEGDASQTQQGKAVSNQALSKNGFVNKLGNAGNNISNGIMIYTDPYYANKLGENSEFSKLLGIDGQTHKWENTQNGLKSEFGPNNTPIILDTQTLSGINAEAIRKAGTEVFQSILEYINGKKSGTASARGTADTVKSQKMNESHLKEEETADWSWESLKVNQGAKQYLSRLYGSVDAIKKGLDDGGNPSMASRIGKRVASEIGKTFGSALTDGADLMMQGFGLGWMMPLIKAGIEEFQKENDNKQYEGIEAWVRDPSFTKISQYFGNPKDFIEGSGDN